MCSQSESISSCLSFHLASYLVLSCEITEIKQQSDDWLLYVQVPSKRYLLCPAAFTIGHLKKFVRIKFSLELKYEVSLAEFVFHRGWKYSKYYINITSRRFSTFDPTRKSCGRQENVQEDPCIINVFIRKII